jgi:hypothetical protein
VYLSNGWVQGTVFLVLGLALGGVAGWKTAAYFAREASKETERQTRMLTTLLVTAEEQGAVKLARDAKGDITGGRVIELRGGAQTQTSASGDLTVGPSPATQNPWMATWDGVARICMVMWLPEIERSGRRRLAGKKLSLPLRLRVHSACRLGAGREIRSTRDSSRLTRFAQKWVDIEVDIVISSKEAKFAMSHPVATLPSNRVLSPWIAALEGRNYLDRRWVLRRMKPRLSRFLYKYRSLDHPHSLENLRDIIVASELRLNRPSDFNDPFDMAAHFVMDATVAQRRTRFKALIREQSPGLGWKEEQAVIQRLMSAPDEENMARCRASLAHTRSTTGIYCFAGTPRNTLMWSHYASNHTGICLQFERALDFSVLGHAMTVKYVPDLPVVNWIVDFQESIGDMLFAKHPCWAYEEESRIVVHFQAGRYLRLKPEALSSIIFGCRSTEAIKATVGGLLAERVSAGYPPVRTYVADMHPTKYRLVIRKLS